MGRKGAMTAGRSRAPGALLVLAVASYSATVGLAFGVDPLLPVALTLGPLAVAALVLSPVARLTFFVLGGLLTLGVTADVSSAKLAYATGVALSTAVSLARIHTSEIPWWPRFWPVLKWASLVVALIIAGLAAAETVDLQAGLRLGVYYLLPLVAPVIGLDAGRSIKPRPLLNATVLIGVFSAVAFAVDWISRRGVARGGLDAFAAASLYLPTFAFGLAFLVTFGRERPRSLRWLPALVVIPLALLLSGNRTTYVFLAVFVALVGRAADAKVPLTRALAALAAVAGFLVGVLPFISARVYTDPMFLSTRFQSALGVYDGSVTSDMSYVMRAAQYRYAINSMRESPWLGNGVSYGFGVSIDNGLAMPVRIGLLGTAALICVVVAAVRALRALPRNHDHLVFTRSFFGALFVVAASLPLTSPVEDRGLGAMVALAFAGVASALSHEDHRDSPSLSEMQSVTAPEKSSTAGLS